MTPLRFAIATNGRFHLLDLAREIHDLGHHVDFYSWVPRRRTERFGLPYACHVDLFAVALPLAGLQTMAPRILKPYAQDLAALGLDEIVSQILRPCDVFIGMSGLMLRASRTARSKYSAFVISERGSRHIEKQREILEAVGAELPTKLAVQRERESYDAADLISVPSQQAAGSFAEFSSLAPKIFVNPYGVDLSMFPLRSGSRPGAAHRLLYVGVWSLQKGADLLEAAVRKLPSASLTHIGAIGDYPFPDSGQFSHLGPRPQPELGPYYRAADLFVLASRQDGYGLVLNQALASGLPVVCTDHTGGAELKGLFPDQICVVPADDGDALRMGIEAMLGRISANSIPLITTAQVEKISWSGYARRYVGRVMQELADRTA